MEQYNTESEYLSDYYEWFRKKVLYAIQEGLILFTDFEYSCRLELELMLKSCKSYADYRCVKDRIEREPVKRLLNKIGKHQIVIFGCGNYGKEICIELDVHGEDVVAFCDNNKSLWGNKCYEIEILPPEVCCREYGGAFYLVTCRHETESVKRQLESLGISGDHIGIWP